MLVLEGLSKLRQLANHPLMVEADYEGDSGKFNEVRRALSNVMAEGHKAIVFSSYVKHLRLVAGFLDEEQEPYAWLTGATQNRQEVVEQFQENANTHIFLMSLKAGGVGLNLTAADYVFILDPWWNPAAENQAINRAHRIGQDKRVFAYRFISKGTIEEKIHRLQERKRELADTFVNAGNLRDLNREQIEELFG